MSDVLEVRALSRTFHQADVAIHVLRQVDLTVATGEIVALLGPSGSGKSTLLQAVGLLEGGFEGSIRIAGEEAARADAQGRTRIRRDRLGFVYQFHHLLPDFTAVENVVLPQLIHGAEVPAAHERAESLLGAAFGNVTKTVCPGGLHVTDAEVVFMALTSYPPGDRASDTELEAFRSAIAAAFAAGGGALDVQKDAALFLSRKPG